MRRILRRIKNGLFMLKKKKFKKLKNLRKMKNLRRKMKKMKKTKKMIAAMNYQMVHTIVRLNMRQYPEGNGDLKLN